CQVWDRSSKWVF
nr:immunoglobulin light chain junction region [Macaca mulatta]MPO03136.1 immunoglobulin light chain junction region [Macaca mulatta]MPO03225.1 immunoglobulin light chain junction region [Macaca mulatta]MPO03255.1 immunoglobulin light chain junction region [Macaca mulatta]MPO03275.1 immunoglobulin light chain junction region [Macaca mulatta]